ncbi:MAG: hypothetical protein AB1757_27115 [Acidobacteriota bacterium]
MHRLQVHGLFRQLKSANLKVGAMVLLLISSALLFAARQSFQTQAAQPTLPEHVAAIAYYSLKGDWDSMLTLNNSANETVSASPVLYSLDGKEQKLPAVSIPAHDSATLRLREFVDISSDKEHFREGSLEVHFNNLDGMAIAPQLTVADANRRMSFDMESPMHFQSSRLESLWWSLDEKTEGQVMLCNTTNQSLDAMLNVEWQGAVIPAMVVSLSSRQTLVMDIEKLLKDLRIEAKGIGRGGLSISHNGAPGALIAAGVVTNKARRFASNLNFIDPATEKVSTLDATGVFIGRPIATSPLPNNAFFTPKLTLKNASDAAQTATVKINYPANGKSESRPLPKVRLAPHEVRTIDLTRIVSGLRDTAVEGAGIAIEYTGNPGSLIASLCSIDEARGLMVDAPLVNRQANSGLGGNHPFQIDDEFRSVAYLTNITDKPTKALVIIFHDGGLFTPELIPVAAGQTVTLDLQAWRDTQMKDVQGRSLPKDLSKGQLFWHPHEGEALIGRVARIDRATNTASNFSCISCCSQEPQRFEVTPNPFEGGVGGFQQMTVMEWDQYCGLYNLGPYDVTNSCQYVSNNTAIATVNATGGVSFVSVGSTTITMSITYYHSEPISAEDCGMVEATESENCPVAVKPTVTKVYITDNPNLSAKPRGAAYDVTIEGTGFAQGATVGFDTTGISSGTAFVESANKLTATFTIAANASGGNRKVIVTVGTQSSTENVYFFVQIPTKVTEASISSITTCDPTHCTINGQPNKCGAYRTLTYQIWDQRNPAQTVEEEGTVTETVTQWANNSPFVTKMENINGNGIFADLVAMTTDDSSCPSNGATADLRQMFSVNINGIDYALSTVRRIQMQKSSGVYTITLTTPTP